MDTRLPAQRPTHHLRGADGKANSQTLAQLMGDCGPGASACAETRHACLTIKEHPARGSEFHKLFSCPKIQH